MRRPSLKDHLLQVVNLLAGLEPPTNGLTIRLSTKPPVALARGVLINKFSDAAGSGKAFYAPVKGTDPEDGQVAIEKNELPHRE